MLSNQGGDCWIWNSSEQKEVEGMASVLQKHEHPSVLGSRSSGVWVCVNKNRKLFNRDMSARTSGFRAPRCQWHDYDPKHVFGSYFL